MAVKGVDPNATEPQTKTMPFGGKADPGPNANSPSVHDLAVQSVEETMGPDAHNNPLFNDRVKDTEKQMLNSIEATKGAQMALVDQSLDGYLRSISGVNATAQAILNRQLGSPSDNWLTTQAALNTGAGRTANALGIQDALRTNTGYVGIGSIEAIMAFAVAGSLTMSKIVTGS